MRENGLLLLVEDRDDDVFLVLRSLERAGVTNPIQVVQDGEQALAYLKGESRFANRADFPLPELVLLDLKLPRVDGFEVLKWIRLQPGLSGLRVVVLTSSDRILDVNHAYALGANSFLVKPMDFQHYVEMASFIYDYWFGVGKSAVSSRDAPKTREPAQFTPAARRVLLRDRNSRKFYAGERRWDDAKQALAFATIDLAENVAIAENLKNVEIVLLYENPPCEITLPIVFSGVRRT